MDPFNEDFRRLGHVAGVGRNRRSPSCQEPAYSRSCNPVRLEMRMSGIGWRF
jgi:hypothetical protein